MRKLRTMRNQPHARVGVFGDTAKAAAHEFGAPGAGIPERSFIRLTFAKQEREQAAFSAKLVKAIVEKGMSVEKALELLGQWGVKEVRATIVKQPSEWEPLSKAYAAKKDPKKTKILVDTGELINSITYEVKMRNAD